MSAGFQKRFKVDNHPLLPFGPDIGRYDPPPQSPSPLDAPPPAPRPPPIIAAGEKSKARDILVAIRTLKAVESENRPATADERDILSRFCGFGPVALSLFPDPITGQYKDGWQPLGDELRDVLTPEEYDSAKRTTFCAFYTSPVVMTAMHEALSRLGIKPGSTLLEPGCGIGRFITDDHRFIGVELDSISGRIARALHPSHDIRIENFRDSKLPHLDAVIGNVPFADIKLDFQGQRFSLHDFFFAKSVSSLRPGGILALVTSRFTLDKQNAAIREHLSSQADFLGAIRLQSDAFKAEGTSVVTDIVFLRKRAPGQEPNHADADWLHVAPIEVEGAAVPVNRYFLNHPENVLGTWSRKDTLYGGEGISVVSNGELASQLKEAIGRLPEACAQLPQKIPEADGEGRFEGAPNRPNIDITTSVPAFIPPPPERHISEGSFFLDDHRVIRQLVDGTSEPVTYCGTLQKANGTPMGRKLGSLIELRDSARRVLQSQNEGWPEANRQDARRALNRVYDLFVNQYGPINKTTFTETKLGGTIRRMPNLVKFREDPDAMLVMSLEEYDEATGKAEKAAIMRKDVVGPKPPITHVTSAEEGLLVSLDHRGSVDLPFIASLYGKPEGEVIAELGDLIYRDPETKVWQTADEYLSGDVRAKLAAAERAGDLRNAEALRQVQPEDVLPGDIDANLGAPWIPVADIQQFAAELFNVTPETIKVGHLKKDAVWSVEPDYRAMQSVAATSDYGTSRVNGITLFEQALNLRTPVIYDLVHNGDREERVVNQEETLAAREKQKLIKERFKGWIFSEPDRTDRLVRIYNDAFNNLRPRLFDGGHLDFPGMSRAITLKPHQVDAVWRCMSSGNTLLAHCVGAGKSFEMAASAMKMKQAGLIKKPLIAVPNHMLEQFSREFMQLYPNAKILVATKEDMSKERRKHLTAKIATGEWDAIVVTHSSFERIGMSAEYQERFLREQIKEYEHLLVDKASHGRNIIKTLEKQKAAREERLKNLLAEDKKDDGLVFDELGVDQIFIDELQQFKNLEIPSKMERVAGIQTGGSERAFDLYMKARYLEEKHPGRGFVGATGTPISNSMVEMYTMQRFLDPEGLRSRGIEHFDGWAATFGEVVDTMEISPDGATLKPRSRFAKFVNLPELTQMFRAFADVQTAEMLDLPRPKLEGGKPETVACPMSEDQQELQAGLIKRYERIRSEKVDPREDNALAITTDGRKLALDGRMLAAGGDFEGSKINALVRNVVRIWQGTEGRRGTQMVFCDMGVNSNPFSAYKEIVEKLADHGIPCAQVAIMGDADTDAKKQALFEKVRQGTIRVLIGSTAKMGTGTNVQKRLIALHHLDAPWKPAEVEQREGRILRQGNENEEVAIYRYVTEGSFDAYMWQALETKARFINQVMGGDCAVRKAEDIGGQELSYAEVKAIASGNPAVLTLAEADAELQRLAILKKNHMDGQYLAKRNLRDLPETIIRQQKRIEGLAADIATIRAHETDPLPQAESLTHRLGALPDNVDRVKRYSLGKAHGLEFGIVMHPLGGTEIYVEGAATRRETLLRDHPGPRATLNAVGRLIDGFRRERDDRLKDLAVAQGQLKDYEARLGAPFGHAEYMSQLADLRDRLKLGLSEKAPEGGTPVAELAEAIKALREANTVEAAPERMTRKSTRAERPVTARLRKQVGEPQSVEVAIEVVTPPETKPEKPSISASPVITTMPEPLTTGDAHTKSLSNRRRGIEAQLRLF